MESPTASDARTAAIRITGSELPRERSTTGRLPAVRYLDSSVSAVARAITGASSFSINPTSCCSAPTKPSRPACKASP